LPNGAVIPAGLQLDSAYIGQIDASKIYVQKLSALSADLGTFTTSNDKGTMTIQGTSIEVKDTNGVVRVKMGIW
ncbi:hypothetical protein I2F29_12825, partial [Acinetobacter sp. FNA3]|nr:hypothetical protein [Acinetobacter pollinis]MBF7700885.1 hypothetical protein [Acinetobacter pollinis]